MGSHESSPANRVFPALWLSICNVEILVASVRGPKDFGNCMLARQDLLDSTRNILKRPSELKAEAYCIKWLGFAVLSERPESKRTAGRFILLYVATAPVRLMVSGYFIVEHGGIDDLSDVHLNADLQKDIWAAIFRVSVG